MYAKINETLHLPLIDLNEEIFFNEGVKRLNLFFDSSNLDFETIKPYAIDMCTIEIYSEDDQLLETYTNYDIDTFINNHYAEEPRSILNFKRIF